MKRILISTCWGVDVRWNGKVWSWFQCTVFNVGETCALRKLFLPFLVMEDSTMQTSGWDMQKDGVRWNQSFQMFGKSVCIPDSRRLNLAARLRVTLKLDSPMLLMNVSRCRTNASDPVGKWIRAPTGRKYTLEYFFKQKKSIAVHANLRQCPGKELWIAETML